MCGIAGFTHTSVRPDPSRIREITRALTHRGPDQQGVWDSPLVSLGAVRLKIIDLHHGEQPMHSDDGDSVLVYNGEIYNHADLRAQLESRGHRFKSNCDTEVVLRGFLEWDAGVFAKLRGMFALAIWSERSRRLVLARDRLGIKPLYVHRRGPELYFGSELKAILLHPEIGRRLSSSGLEFYLTHNWIPEPYTAVEGMEKLPPGQWLEWRDGLVVQHSYWRLNFAENPKIGLEDAKSELDSLLRSSVREHLISDVPLGVWSSGGLDSTSILHYAAESSSSRLKTFSVSFRGRSFDESRYFQEVSRHYGTDHHEYDLSPDESLAGAIEEFAWYSDEPSADAGALPVWFLSKMCRSEVTVALSGDGADEIFGGYTTYLADRYAGWLRATPAILRRAASVLSRRLPVSDEKIGLDYKITRMLAGSMLPPVDAHFFWNGAFSAEERQRLGVSPRARLHFENPRGVNDFLRMDQLTYLPDDILYKVDRMSMAHSLEVRPPFLDHRIVEFASRLPANLKIRGTTLKYVLRELMKDKLPRAVIERPKEGFDIPAHHWLRTTLKPLLLNTLTNEAARDTGVFRWPAIQELLRAHLERRANLGYQLWGLLVLFLWMKQWSIQAPKSGKVEELTGISAVN